MLKYSSIWQNACFATMQFCSEDPSNHGYGDQHYITRFTYSFTKDNLARCTKSTIARNGAYNNEKICMCASL